MKPALASNYEEGNIQLPTKEPKVIAKPRLQVSFSGGRTSAFMSIWLKQNKSSDWDMKFVFANTGWEHPDTLRFVNEIDTRYNLNLTWVESVPQRHLGKSSGHKVVSYETASRDGEPFENVVKAYGLPNSSFTHCTRELKLNPIRSWCRSEGWANGSYTTAIGIRADETRRINPNTAAKEKFWYPLAQDIPTTKEDVLDYFESFDWDLRIKEHQGNCLGCHKKSDKKLLTLYREDPKNFDLAVKLENLYASVGPNNVPGPRKMYRGYASALELVSRFASLSPDYRPPTTDGGCSESCELYPTT